MVNRQERALREIIIEPVAQWGFIDLRELYDYRDLVFFMIWRSIKVAYAQSIGGIAWAIIQPAVQILVFSLVFGSLLGVQAEGIPYPLITTVAVIVWSYMSSSLSSASGSLVTNAGMLAKIYFPRIIFLVTPAVGGLLGFAISMGLMIAVLVYYQVTLTLQILYLPGLLLLMFIAPLGFSLWLASLAIRFRDVRIVMTYFMRLLIYAVPVMYPSSYISDEIRPFYIINPFVGIIEGFQSCILGLPMMWDSLLVSIVVSTILLLTGAVYFRRMERVIVDVI